MSASTFERPGTALRLKKRLPGRGMIVFRTGVILCALAAAACQSNKLDVYRKPINTPSAALAEDSTKASPTEETETTESEGYGYRLSDITPAQRPATGTVEGGIWYQADKAEVKIARSGKRIKDGPLPAYVEKIVCTLAGPYCDDIRVYVVRTNGFNASMMPNGALIVQSGFLIRVRSEAQLATVLGHEIGHYLRRHSLKRTKDTVTGANTAAWVGILLGVPLGPQVFANLREFSRDHEREADGYGLLLMSRAGYDPRQATWVWDRLVRIVGPEAIKERKRYNFMATHPTSPERSKALRIIAKELEERGDVAAEPIDGFVEYQNVMAEYRADFIEDEIADGNFDELERLLEILIGDGENRAELLFYRGEIFRRRGKKKDPEQAMFAYNRAFRAGTPPPEIHRSIGLIHFKLKEFDQATEHFAKYLELKPDAKDASIVKSMMGAGT